MCIVHLYVPIGIVEFGSSSTRVDVNLTTLYFHFGLSLRSQFPVSTIERKNENLDRK